MKLTSVYSRPESAAINHLLETSYSLAPIIECDFYVRGLHDNYLVTTSSQKYILRLYRNTWRNLEEIGFELDLLRHLQQKGSPVAHPLAANNGNLYLAVPCCEGIRYATLFSYAHGIAPGNNLSVSQATDLGDIFAQLHHHSESFTSRYHRRVLDLVFLLDKPLSLIMPYLDNEKRTILAGVAKDLHARLKDFPIQPPYFSPCMGDLNNHNFHIDPQQRITLFDFDQCGFGWRAFDIGKYFSSLTSQQNRDEIQLAFLHGYERQRPLLAEEHENLDAFTLLAHIWVMGIHVENVDLIGRKWLDEPFWQRKFATIAPL